MLSILTLKRLMRHHFPEHWENKQWGREFVGLKLAERQKLLEGLKPKLESLGRIGCRYYIDRSNKDDDGYLSIKVEQGADQRSGIDWFQIRFAPVNEELHLYLFDSSYRHKNQAPGSKVTDIDQVTKFLLAVLARQDKTHLRVKKKEKTANFQQMGLAARLTELAQRHRFAYAIGQNNRDVLLSIRVGRYKTGYHFSFPKGKLAAMIEQVPEMITSFERLRSLGVMFRNDNSRWIDRQGPWVEPSPDQPLTEEVEEHAGD